MADRSNFWKMVERTKPDQLALYGEKELRDWQDYFLEIQLDLTVPPDEFMTASERLTLISTEIATRHSDAKHQQTQRLARWAIAAGMASVIAVIALGIAQYLANRQPRENSPVAMNTPIVAAPAAIDTSTVAAPAAMETPTVATSAAVEAPTTAAPAAMETPTVATSAVMETPTVATPAATETPAVATPPITVSPLPAEQAVSPSPGEQAASPAGTVLPTASPKPKPTSKKAKPKRKARRDARRLPPGRTSDAAANAPAPGGGHGQVWVDTETRGYYREGSRFYGTTRKGKYMIEQDAINAGYKPALKRP